MISEKKINYYLHFAENSYNEECQKIITQLIDEVHKLEREANWFAKRNWPKCPAVQMIDNCEDNMRPENCRKCWRAYAKESVQND